MPKFSDVLKELRKAKHLTQQEFADELSRISNENYSRSAIGMWESDSRVPDLDTLDAIADYFNVDMNYLLGKTDKTTYIPNPNAQTDKNYAKNETEDKLLLLCRRAEDVSDEEKEDIVNLFESTIDLYLKAKGIKHD